jgi:transposase
MGRLWRFSRTETSRIFQPGRCIRALFGETRCGGLSQCDNALPRDQSARLSRKACQRLGAATATLWMPAKNTDRPSAGKEKTAPVSAKSSLDDAMMLKTTPRRSPFLKALYGASAELKSLARVAKNFFEMVRKRDASLWPAWLKMAKGSPLASFARRLQRDKKAVAEALRLPWSNGMVEGQIHRLKLIKRQMYGRAGFDLLRLRVLQRA